MAQLGSRTPARRGRRRGLKHLRRRGGPYQVDGDSEFHDAPHRRTADVAAAHDIGHAVRGVRRHARPSFGAAGMEFGAKIPISNLPAELLLVRYRIEYLLNPADESSVCHVKNAHARDRDTAMSEARSHAA